MLASLGSSGKSWGVSSIAQDAQEIAKMVAFVKELRPEGKIVLMGHSTGCQDCMEYVVGAKAEEQPGVDGVILQAPVSDREALDKELPKAFMHEANQLALKMCREGRDKDAMPNRLTRPVFGRVAITARRWVDIASPGPDHVGADDYFSSDLPDERLARTFGKFPARTPLLILQMGSDESVPDYVDTGKLWRRWVAAVQAGGGIVDERWSGKVSDATHNLNGQPPEVVQRLTRAVTGFIAHLENGEFSPPATRSNI